MKRSCWQLMVTSVVLLCLAGCTKRDVNGETIVYSFAWWVPCSVFLVGVAAAPVGWSLRGKTERWGWGLLIASPIALMVFFPGLLKDNLTIGTTSISLSTGLWFAPTKHEVRFDDLASVDLTAKRRYSRRGSRITYTLVCKHKSGTTQSVPIGDLMKEALPEVLERLRLRGVSVTDKT